jgi:hypothetical protein
LSGALAVQLIGTQEEKKDKYLFQYLGMQTCCNFTTNWQIFLLTR